MKIAIYSRVSTDKQENENQLADLQTLAVKQGWSIFDQYVDVVSGGKSDRPEFTRMFADASKRKFDLVLFWALDRLSREGVLATLTHLNRLESYGVGFRSYSEPYFDSCGVFKDAVIAIMATLARQEKIKISERTKAGLARVRAAGGVLGRPCVTATVFKVEELKASGLSNRATARVLSISESSVRKLLKGALESSAKYEGRSGENMPVIGEYLTAL